jgi:transposase-like protein
LLRGEDLETVSRALGVTAATLTAWRDSFLAAGEAALATRPMDGETLESERLKARLGDMLLKHELLEQKIAGLEGGRPLARGRWKR